MAVITTDAICIQRAPFGDTSQVIHWITADFGRIAALAKGAFREKNRYQDGDDLLVLSRITLSRRDGGLALLRERRLLDHFPGLRRSLPRFAAATVVAECVRWGVPEGQVVSGLFPLVKGALSALSISGAERDLILFTFLWHFLRMLGFEPVLSRCTECDRVPAPAASLYIDFDRGGVVCRQCRSGKGRGITISGAAARAIQGMARLSLRAIRGSGPGGGMNRDMWAFFEGYVPHVLERDLGSLAFARRFAPEG